MNPTPQREQRRFRRFELKLPFELVRTGSRRVSDAGQTRNLSSGGVLFTVCSPPEVGERIEYFITLPTGPASEGDVRLLCRGKVVRLEHPPADPGAIAVAATLERYEFIRQAGTFSLSL
jgi:hypothetical protein